MYGEDHFDNMGPAPALAAGEYVVWKGKPKRNAYIADKALSMLPLAVFWAIFDLNFLRLSGGDGMLLLFLAVHMMPVWLWIGSALTSVLQWNNEEYYVTNMRIIIRKGVFKPARQTLFLRDVHSCDIHYGLLDRLFGSGDIYLNHTVYRSGKHRRTSGWYLMNLADPEGLRERIEQLALSCGSTPEQERFY